MKLLKPFRIPLSGINLIEASAGTGKTYNIASLYVRALIERQREVKQILVVTYTEAATKELRERLMRRLRESVQALEGKAFGEDEFLRMLPQHVDDAEQAVIKLKEAIRSFDEAAIYTIHGFCYQALQEQAFESRALFDAELTGDDKEIVREVIDDYWRNWVHEASQSPLKRPLLKLLMDKGYNPDTLTDELAGFTGKPYLDIQPEDIEHRKIEEQLKRLAELFDQLKSEWESSQEEIFKLLDSGHLSYYRTDWLQGWMLQIHDWLRGEVPPIDLFDKFEKFTQSTIDNSLKKESEKKGIAPPEHPFFKQADSYQSLAESLSHYDIKFKLKLFKHLPDTLDARKEEQQLLSYDDLLIQLRNALVDSVRGAGLAKTLRHAYPIALVDEFQDTDPIQYEIFRTIYGNGEGNSSLFMIGDPKQSIYSFRGADIFAYLKAKNDAREERTFSLDRNFRSVPELIKAINALFGHQENPFILEDIPFHPVRPGKEKDAYKRLKINRKNTAPIEILKPDIPSDELPLNKSTAQKRSARDTAVQIQQLLNQSKNGNATIGADNVRADDIAVLVRSHFQAGLIRDALREKGIKSVQYSQDSVFKSDEASDLQYMLKAVAEPANEGFVKTALATNVMGYKAEELLRFEEDESAWVEKLEQFSGWHAAWQEHGFAYMFRQILKGENIPEKLITLKEGERKLTNLIHLSELLQQEEQDGKTGIRSLLQWLARKRNEEQKDREEEQLRLESDEHLVKVVTMHRSKGLEYPVVFCPFLWHGSRYSDSGRPFVYHDRGDASKVYLDFHGKADPGRTEKRLQMAKEDLAESVRLAYVAITRAEQKCVLSWIPAAKSEYSPLGYLLLGQEESFKVLKDTLSSDSKYEPVDPAKFDDSLAKLIQGNADLFAVNSNFTSKQQEFALSHESPKSLTVRSFKREQALKAGAAISSFSSLIRSEQADFEIDYDIYFDERGGEEIVNGNKQTLSIFNFPKGPDPGTAIHHIFEQTDFRNPGDLKEIITENLAWQGIAERWVPVVSKLVTTTLNKNLLGEGQELRLCNIERRNLIPELEFYFTSGEARLKELLRIIRPGHEIPPSAAGFSEEGFMKGFIDLTIKHQNRYYILDYKTNHLGNTVASYGQEHLEIEMEEAMYDLQYHLYTVALHRYLSCVDRDYSYETHFGGVVYLFLRGINEAGNEGIYFDRPDSELIKDLDTYLGRKVENG